MRGDLPRRWAWVIGAGCVIVLALTMLLFNTEQAVEPKPLLEITSAAKPPPGAAEPAPPIDEPLAAASVPASHGADEVEVCGGGWVKVPDEKAATPEQAEIAQAEFNREYERVTQLPQRRDELLSVLSASPDEFTAAAARLAEARVLKTLGDQAAAANRFDAFMRTALSTRNPKVYALAFKECGSGAVQEGACSLVTARHWALLDPDNAAPWMFLLAGAEASNASAMDEALHRIATAKRSDMYFLLAVTALTDGAPSSEKLLPAIFDIVIRQIGVEAAQINPPVQRLVSACSSAAMKDANRAQTCESAAELLTERSTSLLEQRIGLSIGKRLGWSTDRIDRIRGESEAHTASRTYEMGGGAAAYGCRSLSRELNAIKTMARLGETGAVRAWVATSGKKPEDFIREERARARKREETAAAQQREEAASAAAASAAAAQR